MSLVSAAFRASSECGKSWSRQAWYMHTMLSQLLLFSLSLSSLLLLWSEIDSKSSAQSLSSSLWKGSSRISSHVRPFFFCKAMLQVQWTTQQWNLNWQIMFFKQMRSKIADKYVRLAKKKKKKKPPDKSVEKITFYRGSFTNDALSRGQQIACLSQRLLCAKHCSWLIAVWPWQGWPAVCQLWKQMG